MEYHCWDPYVDTAYRHFLNSEVWNMNPDKLDFGKSYDMIEPESNTWHVFTADL